MTAYLRLPALTAIWLAFVALAAGCFFAPRGAEAQPVIDDVIGFSCSLAISGAVSAIAAFAIGGRRRWAVELSIGAMVVGALIGLLLAYLLWIDPTFSRRYMSLSDYHRFQARARRWPMQLAGYHAPLGAWVGIVLGTFIGLVTRLGRRMGRLATAIALALLFVIASGPGRHYALDLVTGWGWTLRRNFVPWSISDDEISITAMILGAISGAVIAGVAMHVTRSR
jgi:hypothetical protein